jgi:hypothetical protein
LQLHGICSLRERERHRESESVFTMVEMINVEERVVNGRIGQIEWNAQKVFGSCKLESKLMFFDRRV